MGATHSNAETMGDISFKPLHPNKKKDGTSWKEAIKAMRNTNLIKNSTPE